MFLAAPWIWIALLILQLVIGIGISMIPTTGGPVGLGSRSRARRWWASSSAILFDAGLCSDATRCGAAKRFASARCSRRSAIPPRGALIKLALIQVLACIAVGTIAIVSWSRCS